MIEKLKNCPNCAGILDEGGRCKYCGSKVYDFLTLDFDRGGYGASSDAKTYIRVKTNGKIMLLPIIYVNNASITISPSIDTYMCDRGTYLMRRNPYIDMELHFCCGDMVSVEEG